jgi:hypothetical protein
MSTSSRPATPEQVRLLIGLSCLPILPLLGFVIAYFIRQQPAAERPPALWAFAFALAVGATMGLAFVRFMPVFGGTVPRLAPVRAAVAFYPIVALGVVVVIARLLHQAVPVTTGFIAGVDAMLAAVLLFRWLRGRRSG